jgi:chromosome segregation ATPase
MSIQHSKGAYTYFFCLGQKNDPAGTCRERYVPACDLEAQVEELYARIQLPQSWAKRLREEMAAEVIDRQAADAAQRELLTRRLAKAEAERRKLLDAYYAGAIDVATLKVEQALIGTDLTAVKDRLGDLDANLTEWQEILELAADLATRCGDAYRKAGDRTRKQFNAAVFERLDVKDGRLCGEQYRPPFDDIFSVCEFEYETRVEVAGIEPASSGFSRGLLRAQPAAGSRARRRHRRCRRAPADLWCPRRPVDGTVRVSPTG